MCAVRHRAALQEAGADAAVTLAWGVRDAVQARVDALESLRARLSDPCPVCLESRTRERGCAVLQCGHVLCSLCLCDLITTKGGVGQIQCVLCRVQIDPWHTAVATPPPSPGSADDPWARAVAAALDGVRAASAAGGDGARPLPQTLLVCSSPEAERGARHALTTGSVSWGCAKGVGWMGRMARFLHTGGDQWGSQPPPRALLAPRDTWCRFAGLRTCVAGLHLVLAGPMAEHEQRFWVSRFLPGTVAGLHLIAAE